MSEQHRTHLSTGPAHRYEALGRVMVALVAGRSHHAARRLDWRAGASTWEIEWRQGPFPADVARAALRAMTADDGSAPGAVVAASEPTERPHYAVLQVGELRITLRCPDPEMADRDRSRPNEIPAVHRSTPGRTGAAQVSAAAAARVAPVDSYCA